MKYTLPILLLAIAAPALAAVDLVTIPRREGVQLTIYNSEDITMVRENRLLTVKQGIRSIVGYCRRHRDKILQVVLPASVGLQLLASILWASST